MTRNVTDAAVLLGVMTGVDPSDPATAGQVGNAFRDYTQFLDDEALDGARIGVWRAGTYNELTAPLVEPILDDAVAALAAEGATIVDPIELDLTAAADHELNALLCEFKSDIATYLRTYTAKRFPKTLADLIEFNNEHPELESGAPESDWNSLIFDLAEATGGRDAACAEIREALTPPTQAEIDGVMAEHELDAIVALTNGPAWETNPVLGDLDGDFGRFVGSSTPAAVAGYGSITVPAGYVGPLPIGVSFIGGAWSEPELIGIAFDFEQATQVREPPEFLETTDTPVSVSAPGPNRRSVAPDRRVVGPAVPGRNGRWVMPPLR
jgi:amidase